MFPSVALGEILLVGAVPVAVAIAVVAAVLSSRRRRLARGLMALAMVVLVTMLVAGRRLSEPLNVVRQEQLARFEPLQAGWSREQVAAALGPPDRVCPGQGAHVHQVQGTQELLSRLYAATAERWIYFVPGAPAAGAGGETRGECRPRHGDGEVAFNDAGRVIWFIELTDETFLNY